MGGQTSSTANHYFRPPVPKPQALNAIPNLDPNLNPNLNLDQRSAERRETRKLNPDANKLKMEIRGARGASAPCPSSVPSDPRSAGNMYPFGGSSLACRRPLRVDPAARCLP